MASFTRISDHGDTEHGETRRSSRISKASLRDDAATLDEYGKLVKFVSTYREAGAAQPETDKVEERRIWYAPWEKRKIRVKDVDDQAGQYPEEWLITNIREGLSTETVHQRRHRSGWNELVSEKENPIAKVLSYFRGPILYGKLFHILGVGSNEWKAG